MRAKKIKKGRKGIIHLPIFLSKKRVYEQRIAVSHNMFEVSDDCDSGWSKLWGISFGHHHWHTSYRFVFRVKDGNLILGYYCYINGVSPQDDKTQKGEFINAFGIIPKDTIRMRIYIEPDKVLMEAFQEQVGIGLTSRYFDKPKKFNWLRTELYPNLKCKQDQVTTFQFLKPITK